MKIPSDLFRQVLDAGQLDLCNGDTQEIINQKRRCNLYQNFYSHFRELNEGGPGFGNVTLSESSLAEAEKIMSSVHEKYMDSVKHGHNIFAFFIEEEDELITEKFRNGDALRFFSDELKPCLAEMIERGVGTTEQFRNSYCEFLTTHATPECRSTEDFWDSSALKFFGYELQYQAELEKLRGAENNNNVTLSGEKMVASSVHTFSPGK